MLRLSFRHISPVLISSSSLSPSYSLSPAFSIFKKNMHSKVAIIGSGPAAHTAAVYTSRANLEPTMYEGMIAAGIAAGGQLTTTTDVENYPGFPDGIGGIELTDKFRLQSIKFGTNILTETVEKVDLKSTPFKIWREYNNEYDTADAIIIATGATARRLHVKGEDQYWQRGISACAVCDGAAPIFRNKPLIVIGGGDSACEEAGFLTKYASKVYLVVRRDVLRASNIMQKRAMNNPKIEILWRSQVAEALGDGKVMTGATIVTESPPAEDGKVVVKETHVVASGLFYAVGHVPNTKFLDGQLPTDDTGYLIPIPGTSRTVIPGVFVAGDVQDKHYRQAITAAGSGCMAALDAEKYLESILDGPESSL
ncbi:Thioredoxin reductase [Smittium mucronatum]|uniref:Thioredoxin reductase n=1 Tax=Smittium mucronatum TaxID=133383 RepID=A0A1R0GUM2_9FUNG|nr:Thioredoxin reductase [Smittium mucronatum]